MAGELVRIGYAKLGRSIHLNPATYGPQGDPAAPQFIRRMAERNPDHTFVIAGKNDGFMDEMPANVENPWPTTMRKAPWLGAGGEYKLVAPECLAYEEEVVQPLIRDMDSFILDLGQHGTTHFRVPLVKTTWAEADRDYDNLMTEPHAWARNYGAFILKGLNAQGDRTDGRAPVAIICEDSRNYLKARDLKWPTGTDDILAQHVMSRTQRHERFRDARSPLLFTNYEHHIVPERGGELWIAKHSYRHGGTEMMILPSDWNTWGSRDFQDRSPIGIATTSAYSPKTSERRSWLVRNFVLNSFPEAEIYGRWDDRSKEDLEDPGILRSNTVAQFPELLGSWRVTASLPPAGRSKDGAQWCAAKPWQCFAANAATFMIGCGDAQGWILPSRRETPAARRVAPGLWSVRHDWTEEDLHLARWLRVESEPEFRNRALIATTDESTWRWLVTAQRNLLRRRWDEALLETTVETRLGL